MSKEKQIRENETKHLLDELSKMPDMVIAAAYLEAINYTLYGVDVTKAWNTAIQQNAALERAYAKGYTHGIENTAQEFRYELVRQNSVLDKIRTEIEELEEGISSYHNDRPWLFKDEVLQIIDKYKTESEDKG